MAAKQGKFDIVKILMYILKRAWVVVLCAELGFGALYFYTTRFIPETFTSSGRMYVNNGNPNLTEYQYTNSGDLNSAVQLINTYLVVVRSDKVMNAVVDKLSDSYPDITTSSISPTLSMASVSNEMYILRGNNEDWKLLETNFSLGTLCSNSCRAIIYGA